jgi:signal transduction histidine kinase
MRPDALIPLVGAIVNLALAVFVLLQSPRSTVARVFFVLVGSFAVWNFGTFWMFTIPKDELFSHNYYRALFWARFLQFGVICIPASFFHLSFLIAGLRIPPKLLYVLYAVTAGLFVSNFSSLVVRGVYHTGFAWYTEGGPLFLAVFFLFALDWASVLVLVRHRRRQPRLVRRRLTPLIVAQTSIALLGSNDALPIVVQPANYPFTDAPIYPVGSICVIFYGLIVGYSVLQHQLLNVHVVLGRYGAHLVRMLFFFCIGFCLLLILAAISPLKYNWVSFFGSLGVLMTSAILASMFFPKLLGGGAEGLERRLLGDQFEYQEQVRAFLNEMSQYTEMAQLQEEIHRLLVRAFRLDTYEIILREEVTNSFILLQAQPEEPSRQLPEFQPDSPSFEYFRESGSEYLILGDENIRLPAGALERQARASLRHIRADFCFPLMYHEEPLGLLLVGKKATGDPFTATDVSLFSELARNLSVVINQIRLKKQITQAQELELLGRMSRGMAHDLNNLLTPISTLLQLTEETGIVNDELLPIASRNLASVRAYIREALFFSEHLRPDIQPARLDVLVLHAIEVAKSSRTKHVRILPRLAGDVPAELDSVLVQRLIANLIANAIDASGPGGEVIVSLERTSRIDADREWLRVRVQDFGEGIPREHLNRIFTPYFTTNNRGDRDRGFGLGLAICLKIASLHGGNLSVESQLRRGTTVQLDLPSRPAVSVETATDTEQSSVAVRNAA